MKISTCEDAALLARLNKNVHTLHHQAYPDIFKPYHYLDTLDLFQKLIERPEHYLLVATEEEEAVGYVWCQVLSLYETPFRYAQKTLYVHQIGIEPEYQNNGYGHALMDYIENIAVQEACDTVELDYWVQNDHAALFYEKEGYETLRHCCRKKL